MSGATGARAPFSPGEPRAMEIADWPGGLRIEISSFVTHELPPDELVTSIRAVVLRGEEVLTLLSHGGTVIVPGGRREPGESHRETLEREVLEESGCRLGLKRRLGVLRFRHLTPEPEAYPYPYPVFWQIVYAARATGRDEWSGDPEGEIQSVRFVSIDTARTLSIPRTQLVLLDALLAAPGFPS